MKKISIFILSILSIVLFLNCKNTTKNKTAEVDKDTLKQEYNINMKQKDVFQFKLKSNISTGYSWNWINQENVTPIDTFNFKYEQSSADRPGAAGTEIWNFRADSIGNYTIILEYRQPWDTVSPAADTVIFNFNVK